MGNVFADHPDSVARGKRQVIRFQQLRVPEMDIHLHETALRLLGEDGDVDGGWMKGYQFALAGPIYAGTNEIQRNVIAERLLGLPRK